MKKIILFLLVILLLPAIKATDVIWNPTGNLVVDSSSGNVSSGPFNLQAALAGITMTGADYVNFTRNGTFLRKEGVGPYFMCGDTTNASGTFAYSCRDIYGTINWSESWNITATVWKSNRVNYTESIILNPGITSVYLSNSTNASNTSVSAPTSGLYFNGSKIYYDGSITHPGTAIEGSLITLRAANGIFDTKNNVSFFDDYPNVCGPYTYNNGADLGGWNASANTARLVAALPYYHAHGVDSVSISFQGGCSCSRGISGGFQWPDNNPFHSVGNGSIIIEQGYLDRAAHVILSARSLNMTVITNLMYFGQEHRFANDTERVALARVYANWLIDNNFTNVLIEVGNERSPNPANSPQYFAMLDAVHAVSAQRNFTLYASFSTGYQVFPTDEYILAADYVSLHTNGAPVGNFTVSSVINFTRQRMQALNVSKPILITEDNMVWSMSNFNEATSLGVGWGYYNDASKQSVPANFEAYTPEDFAFFDRAAQVSGVTP